MLNVQNVKKKKKKKKWVSLHELLFFFYHEEGSLRQALDVVYSLFLYTGSTRVTDSDESGLTILTFPIRHQGINSRLDGRITASFLPAQSLTWLMMTITIMIVTMMVNKLLKQ